jgi:hypothetical protein
MNEIAIPLYLLFGVTLVKLVLDVVWELRRARDSAEYLDQMAAVQENQQALGGVIDQHHRDWRAVVEHETGKKFSEMSDAEILTIARATDEAKDQS